MQEQNVFRYDGFDYQTADGMDDLFGSVFTSVRRFICKYGVDRMDVRIWWLTEYFFEEQV